MDDPTNPARTDRAYFREICQNSGFWSSCGYEGLAMAFDLPLENLRPLPDDQKRALMRLLAHLARMDDGSLQDRVRELESQTAEKRLADLVQLSTQFAA